MHHHHQDRCPSALASTTLPNTELPSAIDICNHCCHHNEQNHSIADDVDAGEEPVDRHQDCDEPTCSYLAAGANVPHIDADVCSLSLDQITVCESDLDLALISAATRFSLRSDRQSMTPTGLCVSQSSWQL